jgi:hypothetical protein
MDDTCLTLIRLSWPSTKRSLLSRKDSFISLLILFLNTASPTFLRTVTAMRFDSCLFLWIRREKWFVSEHFTHRVFLKSPLVSLSFFVKVKEVIRCNDQWQVSENRLETTRNSLHNIPVSIRLIRKGFFSPLRVVFVLHLCPRQFSFSQENRVFFFCSCCEVGMSSSCSFTSIRF